MEWEPTGPAIDLSPPRPVVSPPQHPSEPPSEPQTQPQPQAAPDKRKRAQRFSTVEDVGDDF